MRLFNSSLNRSRSGRRAAIPQRWLDALHEREMVEQAAWELVELVGLRGIGAHGNAPAPSIVVPAQKFVQYSGVMWWQ